MTDALGAGVDRALAELVDTMDNLPGAFRGEFSLTYWAGVSAGAEPWCCNVEADLLGDDGSAFNVLGYTAEEALRLAANEARRRVPPSA